MMGYNSIPGRGFNTEIAKSPWRIAGRIAREVYSTVPPSEQYAKRVHRLLFMTMAHESQGFIFRRQRGFGNATLAGAWGLCQVEWISMLESFRQLSMRPELGKRVSSLLCEEHAYLVQRCVDNHEDLISQWRSDRKTRPAAYVQRIVREQTLEGGDKLNILFARLHYLWDPNPVPESPTEQAEYAKRVFNTEHGDATPAKYLEAYKRWISITETVNKEKRAPSVLDE